ncbi:helix-turn-helix domain-containing protein [Streptomyces celluloflavus]|uniref:DNA-binding protein n=1 Tax=Streptomyces kasugaensis TaxID=1946 RepID=A0A4Q9HMV5_STRKA|nr:MULTISPECIES: pyridoxamine 5'-phosphate oxidase family protein [Streptomyces]MYU51514.1 helix-turn-helix domain-containing protein [Streptomyces sp. SID7805]TBO56174.1 DNA-binding protein [Streptomyces kasugaensis]
MTDHETGSPTGPALEPSDLGRRVALRRQQLGLTREQVAARAAAAPDYLRYVEEQPATPGMGFMLRLAEALDTSVAELVGGTAELPAGLGRAAARPEVLVLTVQECRELLATHGVGRVAVTVADAPAVFPVNYTVAGKLVAYRTAPDAGPAAAAGHEAALEVDHLDDAFSAGWSVLVVGPAHAVTDLDELLTLEENAYTAPWVGGGRRQWIAIRPKRVTGRRIRVQGSRRRSRTPGPEDAGTGMDSGVDSGEYA